MIYKSWQMFPQELLKIIHSLIVRVQLTEEKVDLPYKFSKKQD